jgi:hypothetical protein
MDMAIDKDAIEKRLKKTVKKVYSIRVEEGLMGEVQAWCDQKGVSYSSLTEELYREFLDTSKKKK